MTNTQYKVVRLQQCMNPYTFQQNQDESPDFQKIIKFFHNKLSSKFVLTAQLRFGQCLVSKPPTSSTSPSHQFSQKRKRYRYIANNKQLFLMQVEGGGSDGFIPKKCIQIKFDHVVGVKLSTYYCGIMLRYLQSDLDEEKKENVLNIQCVNIGRTRDQQLRQHLVKFIGSCRRKQKDNWEELCERTLLDFERFKKKEKEEDISDEDLEMDEEGDLIIRESEIKQTKVINLRKKKAQVARLFQNQSVQSGTNIFKQNLNDAYRAYSQICYQNQPSYFKLYLVEKLQKTTSTSSQKILSILKIIPKQSLNDPTILSQLYNQSQAHKNYKIVSPYVPSAKKLFHNHSNVLIQYKYFQGLTLRELRKKERLGVEKKWLRDLIAEIVIAVGHLHQCGYAYGVTMDNVMVDCDGHVLLHDVGAAELIGGQDPDADKRWKQLNLPKVRRNKRLASPEEIMHPEIGAQRISDWWCLGLLLFEIIIGVSQEQINQILLDTTTPLNLHYLQSKTTQIPQLPQVLSTLLTKSPSQRIGSKNDYHPILSLPYFKGIDKNKLMRRQGPPLLKIKPTKLNNFVKLPEDKFQALEMREIQGKVSGVLGEGFFDRGLEFQ